MFDSFDSCSLIRNRKIKYRCLFLTLFRKTIQGEFWRHCIENSLNVIPGIGTHSQFSTFLVYFLKLFLPFLNPEEMSVCRIQVMRMKIVVVWIIVMGTPTIIWSARFWFWKMVHLDFLLSNLQGENPSSLQRTLRTLSIPAGVYIGIQTDNIRKTDDSQKKVCNRDTESELGGSVSLSSS